MNIIVNDANILIDIVELQLVQPFFSLNYDFYTTSLIFEELDSDQQIRLKPYREAEVLHVQDMDAEQLKEIKKLQQLKSALSLQDCSAFYQARIMQGILVTSDNVLRKFAKKQELRVHGHLWVFDELYMAGLLSGAHAVKKLNELRTSVNPALGLPEKECALRIDKWIRV